MLIHKGFSNSLLWIVNVIVYCITTTQPILSLSPQTMTERALCAIICTHSRIVVAVQSSNLK